jgi:hypothetical protein
LSKRIATVNLEAGFPTAAETRRRVTTELEVATRSGIAVLKLIHGYGSTGKGGKLRRAVRAELTQIRAERRIGRVVFGEAWSIFDEDSRALLERYPDLRRDVDLERANAGITLVEVKPS